MAQAKMNGRIWGLAFIRYVFFFYFIASSLFFLDIANLIFDLKYKVMVMAKVNIDGHIWGLASNRYIFLKILWQSFFLKCSTSLKVSKVKSFPKYLLFNGVTLNGA